jgi:hypothetical protein
VAADGGGVEARVSSDATPARNEDETLEDGSRSVSEPENEFLFVTVVLALGDITAGGESGAADARVVTRLRAGEGVFRREFVVRVLSLSASYSHYQG